MNLSIKLLIVAWIISIMGIITIKDFNDVLTIFFGMSTGILVLIGVICMLIEIKGVEA